VIAAVIAIPDVLPLMAVPPNFRIMLTDAWRMFLTLGPEGIV